MKWTSRKAEPEAQENRGKVWLSPLGIYSTSRLPVTYISNFLWFKPLLVWILVSCSWKHFDTYKNNFTRQRIRPGLKKKKKAKPKQQQVNIVPGLLYQVYFFFFLPVVNEPARSYVKGVTPFTNVQFFCQATGTLWKKNDQHGSQM